ncbi:MAG TPA: DUF4159 domain-containing protein [bacterium]|nr:DUF4159 domain-containing protein [bacterium]HNS48797.1 DUF4159 domain-containing protein [bacterium]
MLLLVFAATPAGAWECGKAPPVQTPQTRKAGEAVPPLPLPATPLRRSEKKNPPSPPVLVGKVVCGPDDRWTRAENDVDNLLRLASQQLSVPYRAVRIDLARFSFDPEEVPILYLTSVEPFTPGDNLLPRFKNYLEKGGFIWANASSGSPEFVRSLADWLGKIYPDRNLYPLYPNHPLKHAFHNLEKVGIMENGVKASGSPDLRVLNLGCRAAVIVSGLDLGCGWALHTHDFGRRYLPEDAVRIGVNLVSYCLAWIEFGKLYGQMPVYAEKTRKKSGKIYLGQVMHAGDWDPHPAALGRLLYRVAEEAKVPVYLERINVDLKKDPLDDIPILYLTGHFDPRLSRPEIEKLRAFLRRGGTLIADSCCGSQEFGAAFRKLMAELLPGIEPARWETGHPVYRAPYRLESFLYTDATPGNQGPLEVYLLDGLPAAVFSAHGLGGGWEGIARPYTSGLSASQSGQLGVNLIAYLLTH